MTTDKNSVRSENREAAKEIVQKMCLMDDDFMSMVLQHKECLELVLNIILGRDNLKVKNCETQYVVSQLYGRSARLDVYAEDTEGKLYDIEVQNIVSGDEIKRIRFYSALMDANYLSKSEKPKNLAETFIIFIMGQDMYKDGLPIYHIERTVTETGKPFNDDLHILLINSQIQDETALGKLMSDFHCRKPEKMNFDVLSERANYYKNGKGEDSMCELVEEYARKRAMEAAKEAAKETAKETAIKEKTDIAKRMLSKRTFSNEEIAEMTALAVQEVERIASEMFSS